MAEKGWTSRVATAAGAAAGTGAAQLGLGYGLGVVVWPVIATTDDSDWLGSLSWATWITASATVFGAVLASRLGGGPAQRLSGAWRLALAASAGVGALVAVALIALPARSAVRDDAFSPQVTAGGYALLGVLFGLVVAYWAVVSRPVAANLMATGVLLWALAITAIVVELAWHRDSATYLTSWQFAQAADGERFGTIFWPSALLTLAAAFLIGAIAVIPAIRRKNYGLGAAVSGVVGPLLVAVAFLALAPRLTGALGPLESAYLIAPYAVLAGLAGSALAVSAGRAAADRRARRSASTASAVAGELRTATVPGKPDESDHSGGSLLAETHAEQAQVPSNSQALGTPAPSGQPAGTPGSRIPGATGSRIPGTAGSRIPGTVAGPASGEASGHVPAETASQLSGETAGQVPGETGSQVRGDTGGQVSGETADQVAPRQRGRFARLIGRANVPAQPSPAGSVSGNPSAEAAVEHRSDRAVSEDFGDRAAGAALPPAPAAAPRPASLDVAPDSAPSAEAARSDSFAASDARTAESARTGTADKVDKGATGGRPTRRSKPAPARAEGADPEIAAAARPNRERARKATTAGPKPSRSTVTPPPSEPTVAQINPKPSSDD
jgi:hypothetical protein